MCVACADGREDDLASESASALSTATITKTRVQRSVSASAPEGAREVCEIDVEHQVVSGHPNAAIQTALNRALEPAEASMQSCDEPIDVRQSSVVLLRSGDVVVIRELRSTSLTVGADSWSRVTRESEERISKNVSLARGTVLRLADVVRPSRIDDLRALLLTRIDGRDDRAGRAARAAYREDAASWGFELEREGIRIFASGDSADAGELVRYDLLGSMLSPSSPAAALWRGR